MTYKDIDEKQKKLLEILQKSDEKQNQDLRDLAAGLGVHKPNASGYEFRNEITKNIQNALQTATMISMCKTANRNFWITLMATIAAVISSVAAWVAVIKN